MIRAKKKALIKLSEPLEKETGGDLLSRSSHRNSTISAGGLNYSVRDGKRCFPAAIATRKLSFKDNINVFGIYLSRDRKKMIKPHG